MTNRVLIAASILTIISGCGAAEPEISTYSIRSVCFSPNGKWLATGGGNHDRRRYRHGGDGELKIWEVGTWKLRASVREGFTGKVEVVAFKFRSVVTAISPKYKRNTTGNPRLGLSLRFYDAAKRKELPSESVDTFSNAIAVAYAPSHDLLVFRPKGSRNTAICDATTLKEKVELQNNPDGQFRFAPHGNTLIVYGTSYISTTADKSYLWLYDAKTGKRLAAIDNKYFAPRFIVNYVNFSPDGKLLAILTNDHRLHLLQSDLSGVVTTLKAPSAPEAFAFAPDSKSIAIKSGYDKCTIYDIKTGAATRSFDGKSKEFYATCMAFSPDGSMLAVGCAGGTAVNQGLVQVWDVKTGKLIKELK